MSADFARRDAAGVVYYTAGALDEISGVRHGFSTRHGGTSPLPEAALNLGVVPADRPENVSANRARFLGALGLDAADLVTCVQVHSDRLLIIEESPRHGNHRVSREGDGLVTRAAGVPLGIQVADCFPVILAAADGSVVASVHAGWRGTLARVAAGMVGAMRDLGGDPGRIVCAVGPGIRSCCFEVEADVAVPFREAFPEDDVVRPARAVGKFRVDLPAALRLQLSAAGVARGDVHDLGACTRCMPEEFFSHRREGARSGRLMAVVARR